MMRPIPNPNPTPLLLLVLLALLAGAASPSASASAAAAASASPTPPPPVDFFDGLDLSIDDLVHPEGHTETVKHEARGLYRDVLPPGGLMKMAWATPILRLNVSSFFPNVDAAVLNAKLAAIVDGIYDGCEHVW